MVCTGDEVTVLLDLVLLRLFAAAHTSEDELDRWGGAEVPPQVASQTNSLPFDRGTMHGGDSIKTTPAICTIRDQCIPAEKKYWQKTMSCAKC